MVNQGSTMAFDHGKTIVSHAFEIWHHGQKPRFFRNQSKLT